MTPYVTPEPDVEKLFWLFVHNRNRQGAVGRGEFAGWPYMYQWAKDVDRRQWSPPQTWPPKALALMGVKSPPKGLARCVRDMVLRQRLAFEDMQLDFERPHSESGEELDLDDADVWHCLGMFWKWWQEQV